MLRGPLKPGDPLEVRIIAGSDTEPTLRDLLLLPDFLRLPHTDAPAGRPQPEADSVSVEIARAQLLRCEHADPKLVRRALLEALRLLDSD